MAEMPQPIDRHETTSAEDLYEGPAILVAGDGTEIATHARLWIWRDFISIPDGPFERYLPATKGWCGVLEAEEPLVERPLPLPGTVRLPDGREGAIVEMSGDGSMPDRIEIEGGGVAPWTVAAGTSPA